ncbi:TPA: hypothetical protein ANIA_11465 [Aspergillus nidulans FGSC A4]|uniref:Uncharacterized protein n=1 Tax=Emericella nidulans (strain FGSC A4 / ATCC 38163 / CBS 112.46 / NRRL 194 / M139) TaxID=227321 RepID=C8VF20_EMENI|nr:TPA: hypothetical protein ANIA_11465 [Aspergillus nidulans FGSC A4]
MKKNEDNSRAETVETVFD